jgi:hypothetical protein
MSRPYFNIDNLTYAGPTLSMSLTYFKLRSTATTATFSIDGFSNSIVVSVTNSNSYQGLYNFNPNTVGEELPYDLIKLTVGTLGTASTTTYTQPTLTYTFTGTVSNTSNLLMQLKGVNVINATSSASLAPTISNFLAAIIGSASATNFTGAAANYTVVASGNSLIFTAPTNTGNLNNGVTISNTITQGGSSFATSSTMGNTFSGGLNNYTLVVNYAPLGPVTGGNEVYTWSV